MDGINYSFGSSKTLRIYGMGEDYTILLSFSFCSAKKETKKAVENQMLHWFSIAHTAIAPGVGVIAAVVGVFFNNMK